MHTYCPHPCRDHRMGNPLAWRQKCIHAWVSYNSGIHATTIRLRQPWSPLTCLQLKHMLANKCPPPHHNYIASNNHLTHGLMVLILSSFNFDSNVVPSTPAYLFATLIMVFLCSCYMLMTSLLVTISLRFNGLFPNLLWNFFLKTWGSLHHFLSIKVHRTTQGLTLSQACYTRELQDHASMGEWKPTATPNPMPSKGWTTSSTEPYCDPTHYRRLVGGLHYLTFTKWNLSYSVNFVYQFMHALTVAHFQLVKRILCYVHGTLNFSFRTIASSTLDLYAFFMSIGLDVRLLAIQPLASAHF